MKLGVELVARRLTALKLGSFFETWVSLLDGTLTRSLGRDEFHLALTYPATRRLAATGRTGICQCDLEAISLGLNQSLPTRPVDAQLSPGAPVLFGLRTNVFLDLPALCRGASLRVVTSEGAVEADLEDRRVWPELVYPGRFLVEVGNLVSFSAGDG